MAIFTNKYFISAFVEGNSMEENLKVSSELAMMLLGYGYNISQVQGCYEGKTEVSYMVVCNDGDEELLVSMGSVFNQKCIGFIDENDVLFLLDAKEGGDNFMERTEIGKVKEVFIPEELLSQLDAYSCVEEQVFTTESVAHLMH